MILFLYIIDTQAYQQKLENEEKKVLQVRLQGVNFITEILILKRQNKSLIPCRCVTSVKIITIQ